MGRDETFNQEVMGSNPIALTNEGFFACEFRDECYD
jgi:O-6-methylguanine DNA methyltransferase